MSKNEKCFDDLFDGVRILKIGRLSKEKEQDLAIKALANLKKDGYKVRWHCVGEGNSKEEYESLIKDNKLEEDFILLDATPNQYRI